MSNLPNTDEISYTVLSWICFCFFCNNWCWTLHTCTALSRLGKYLVKHYLHQMSSLQRTHFKGLLTLWLLSITLHDCFKCIIRVFKMHVFFSDFSVWMLTTCTISPPKCHRIMYTFVFRDAPYKLIQYTLLQLRSRYAFDNVETYCKCQTDKMARGKAVSVVTYQIWI